MSFTKKPINDDLSSANDFTILKENYFKMKELLLDNQFDVCSGEISFPNDSQWSLFFNQKQSDDFGQITLTKSSKLSVEEISRLREMSAPAMFGKGQETVFDENYRKAWKIFPSKKHQFITDFQELNVLDQVQKSLNLDPNSKLIAKFYAVNGYDQGCFFKPHVDTPKAKNHVASLVVCLPSDYTGGELVIGGNYKNEAQTEEMTDQLGDVSGENTTTTVTQYVFLKDGSDKIRFVAFPSDALHEILPVTGGTRVTLAFDLFVVPIDYESPADVSTPFDNQLVQTLQSLHEILGKYNKIFCFDCKHMYPTGSTVSSLKGVDGALFRAAKKAGFSVYFGKKERVYGTDHNIYFKDDLKECELGTMTYEEDPEACFEGICPNLGFYFNNQRFSSNEEDERRNPYSYYVNEEPRDTRPIIPNSDNERIVLIKGGQNQRIFRYHVSYGNDVSINIHYGVISIILVPEGCTLSM